jgi:hypothetical protein
MKRILVLTLIIIVSTLAAARDKKVKPHPGPYIFTSKASAQTVKALIVQQNLIEGYTLDSDNQFQFRFSQPGEMPPVDEIFMASSGCKGMTTKKVWSYTLLEINGTTKITVIPFWEYPDDYCEKQTKEFLWSRPEEMAAFQAMLDKAPVSSTPAPSAIPASPAAAPVPTPVSAADQQKTKQHAACVELAKANPSIVCQ